VDLCPFRDHIYLPYRLSKLSALRVRYVVQDRSLSGKRPDWPREMSAVIISARAS
jgi:hypothetical protein